MWRWSWDKQLIATIYVAKMWVCQKLNTKIFRDFPLTEGDNVLLWETTMEYLRHGTYVKKYPSIPANIRPIQWEFGINTMW